MTGHARGVLGFRCARVCACVCGCINEEEGIAKGSQMNSDRLRHSRSSSISRPIPDRSMLPIPYDVHVVATSTSATATRCYMCM